MVMTRKSLPMIQILVSIILFIPGVLSLCSASQPCSPTEGCCSLSGYCGFGPDYCGAGNCTSNCDRKSECNPGWPSGFAVMEKCPLNVCCSKWGNCGTTAQFCGENKVKRPACTGGNLMRAVGYYEGWSIRRPCGRFSPERLPLGIYTHINFAFATIDPETFTIRPANTEDIPLYTRLTDLKQEDPQLNVFIAIGGWTFNDPGPSRNTFSDLAAASIDRQRVFFQSLISFMSTYGFDGVDIDWEYPQADDRGGRSVDYANFPAFIKNLREALTGTKAYGISLTLPASYWYLRHFDLKALEPHVDFFNMMTYDMHGLWDRDNKWTGPFLNAHTNLTEIKEAMDLVWRNDISSKKIVLGVGFYGRAFTTTDKSCMRPGCTFKDAANGGNCTREPGILMNSEIEDILAQRKIAPTLDREAAVKIASWDDQWVAYDDSQTFQLKADYARSQCMSGLMVWAISHDNPNATNTLAFGAAVGRKGTAWTRKGGDIVVKVPIPQCKWTACGEVCPAGFVPALRKDSAARKNELMLDDGDCGGQGSHTFCCPGDQEMPSCGWYTHNNGKCDNQCPSGHREIGSHSKHCKEKYQAACCRIDTPATEVYGTCDWALWPRCKLAHCPWINQLQETEIASSIWGSGASFCDVDLEPKNSNWDLLGRKLCCDTGLADLTFVDCDWYDNIGNGQKGRKNSCRNGCPADKVRVALDQWGGGCMDRGGARARCCTARKLVNKIIPDPGREYLERHLRGFIKNPTCPPRSKGPFQARWDTSTTGLLSSNLTHTLLLRDSRNTLQDPPDSQVAYEIAFKIITHSSRLLDSDIRIWDANIPVQWNALDSRSLADFVPHWVEYDEIGARNLTMKIICAPDYYQLILADQKNGGHLPPKAIRCGCTTACNIPPLDDGGKDLPDEGPPEDIVAAANAYTPRNDIINPSNEQIKRPPPTHGNRKAFDFRLLNDNRQEVIFSFRRCAYTRVQGPITGGWRPWYVGVTWRDRNDCDEPRLGEVQDPNREDYAVNWAIPAQLFVRFLQDANRGYLWTPRPEFGHENLDQGRTPARINPNLRARFFEEAWERSYIPNPRVLPHSRDAERRRRSPNPQVPHDRLMEALGSVAFEVPFLLLHENLNARLEYFMNGAAIPTVRNARNIVEEIRTIYTLVHILHRGLSNNPVPRILLTAMVMREELGVIDTAWNAANPDTPIRLRDFWVEWYNDYLRQIETRARSLLNTWFGLAEGFFIADTPEARASLQIVNRYRDLLDERINLSGLRLP